MGLVFGIVSEGKTNLIAELNATGLDIWHHSIWENPIFM